MEHQHSRSASPRDAPRPQHRPPSPPTPPEGFDNRAYQHDEDHNHNDSFSSHVPQHHNNSKEPIAETKALEAVNLELINLSPKNGKKKDVDVEMNASNPYDEYFVPVNEHRKYMRGEKLYVTADKRGEKGGCKRPLCWTLLALVVAAIIALIVLAATGVLFASSPTPLDQYNTTISSARALGGLGVGETHDHGTTEHDHSAHDHSAHDHSAHDHSTHGHNAHDHSAHDHSAHDHNGHDHDDSNHEHTDNNHDHNHVDQKHIGHDHSEHDPSPSPEPTPERSINDAMNPASDESTESEADYKFSHVFGHPIDPKAEQEPTPEPEPEPESKAELEPESKAEPEPKAELEPEPKAEPEPEPNAEPEPEPEPKAEPEPEPEPKAEPENGQKAESESESKPEPELTLQPEPAPVAEPEPTSEPEPTADPKLESESSSENESKQVSDSETKHSPETAAAPEPTIEPKVHPEPAPVVEPNSEIKQTSETTEKPTYSVFEHYSEIINKSHNWDYLQNMDDQQNSKEFETTHLPVTEAEMPPINYIPVTEEQPDETVTILQDYSGENNNMEVIMPKTTSVNHMNSTEFDNDWLDPIPITNDELKFLNDETNTSDTNTQFTNDMHENMNMGKIHETQARSFKKQDMEYQVTAETPDDNKDDFRGDTKTTEQGTIEESNSRPAIALFAYQDKLDKNRTTTYVPPSTTPKLEEIMVDDETDKPTETEIDIENRTESKTLNNEIEKSKAIDSKNEPSSKTEKSDMMTKNDIARLLQPHKEITTTASTTRDSEFSLKNGIDSGMEKQLMEVLDIKNTSNNKYDSPMQKEKDLVDENVDITFDAINMLYNRSTKPTENKAQVISIAEMTTETTDSDWLTEAVTEIDYEEMKENIKPIITSETAQKPEDVIMRGALPKYDFEPDYLNNFGPSRTSEQDEPHYGMIHDYDNEDSRVKRVNIDLKESRNSRSEEQLNKFSTSKPSINEKHVTTLMSTDTSSEEESKLTTNRADEMTTFSSSAKVVEPINDKVFNNEKESTLNVTTEPTKTTDLVTEVNEFDKILKFVEGEKNQDDAIETTTVGQFIYNSAERYLDISTANNNTENNNPAPVWEDISDNTKSILFKPSTVRLEQDSSEDSMSKNVTSTTAFTPLTVIITNGNISSNETDNASLTFQKNNLNVTIYEVPGHNSSIATSGHSHSAEYDDHETEMNPFLPEVENNKHLVKKLQEGHDLESLNANETQNENAEEQQFRSLNTQSVDEGTMKVSKDRNMTNNDGKKVTNVNSNENAAEIQVHKFQKHNNIATQERHNTAENKVSSFLSDTDDLDKPLPSTSAPSVSASITDDTEYLSVVPIKNLDGKATLKKKNKSDSIEELNDISDSRKKSDRRTLDAKKLGSVTNNEA
ncbi:putative uncharacterized protein DDB_G0282133 isoform X3 [Hyposmocoma kahamanoa]|uniref:putative uncharacterized protein DDB_G0282133 isoform X3 n=1 Tax=Hyposmocoma kahamanoa TaxID=1477025 RepID=UPI000E6D8605|nr:putative uncharacterized protein DDB_G0282133 isoform X3 [Hyposmocoma kahamanoa]